MEQKFLPIQIGKCYRLRNGFETEPIRKSNCGDKYIFEAKIIGGFYEIPYVKYWLANGKTLLDGGETSLDIVEEIKLTTNKKKIMKNEKMKKAALYLNNNNIDGSDILDLWNEYCSENNPVNTIYHFNQLEVLVVKLYGNNVLQAFGSGIASQINWGHKYLYLDDYGNIVSVPDPSSQIDEDLLVEWLSTKI